MCVYLTEYSTANYRQVRERRLRIRRSNCRTIDDSCINNTIADRYFHWISLHLVCPNMNRPDDARLDHKARTCTDQFKTWPACSPWSSIRFKSPAWHKCRMPDSYIAKIISSQPLGIIYTLRPIDPKALSRHN